MAGIVTSRDATPVIRRQYERKARFYQLAEWLPEHLYRRWRRRLWAEIEAGPILEIGVGTGFNIPFYPAAARVTALVTALDFSPAMLAQARRRPATGGIRFCLGDVQRLPFADASFAAVVATCVFSSVPDPAAGMREVHRVLRPGGRVHLIDHGLSDRPLIGRAQARADRLAVRLTGVHLNRRLAAAVEALPFVVEEMCALDPAHVFRLIRARRPLG